MRCWPFRWFRAGLLGSHSLIIAIDALAISLLFGAKCGLFTASVEALNML